MLLGITVVAAWLGLVAHRASQQRTVVRWITKSGGSVDYDFQLRGSAPFTGYAKPPGPKWLRELIGIDYFADVASVNLNGRPIADLSPLSSLKRLEELYLENTNVSDVSPLSDLTRLRRLDLGFTQIRDVRPLMNMSKLNDLYIPVDNDHVSEAACQQLQVALPNCNIWSEAGIVRKGE